MFDSPTFYTTPSPISPIDNTFNYLFDDLVNQDDQLYLASSYYQLPSPLIYNEIDSYMDLNLAFINGNSSISEVNNTIMGSNKEEETITKTFETGDKNKNIIRRVRSSKKDRHSKINTAHGLRDRRMRLSLEVARPFFKLQDMLRYDKASLTVKWLLLQSKTAIDELLRSKKEANPSEVTTRTMSNSTSEYEVESIVVVEHENSRKRSEIVDVEKDIKNKQKIRKITLNSKELRKEARARARKRTLERSMQTTRI